MSIKKMGRQIVVDYMSQLKLNLNFMAKKKVKKKVAAKPKKKAKKKKK